MLEYEVLLIIFLNIWVKHYIVNGIYISENISELQNMSYLVYS
jgi:hypothetical protein